MLDIPPRNHPKYVAVRTREGLSTTNVIDSEMRLLRSVRSRIVKNVRESIAQIRLSGTVSSGYEKRVNIYWIRATRGVRLYNLGRIIKHNHFDGNDNEPLKAFVKSTTERFSRKTCFCVFNNTFKHRHFPRPIYAVKPVLNYHSRFESYGVYCFTKNDEHNFAVTAGNRVTIKNDIDIMCARRYRRRRYRRLNKLCDRH